MINSCDLPSTLSFFLYWRHLYLGKYISMSLLSPKLLCDCMGSFVGLCWACFFWGGGNKTSTTWFVVNFQLKKWGGSFAKRRSYAQMHVMSCQVIRLLVTSKCLQPTPPSVASLNSPMTTSVYPMSWSHPSHVWSSSFACNHSFWSLLALQTCHLLHTRCAWSTSASVWD